jgi:Ca2+-binding EF-hand superfamily protein
MNKIHVLSVFGLITAASVAAFAHGGHGPKKDLNGDGKVTLAEAQDAAKKRFTELDKNKDGALVKDELSGKGSRKFERADANNDGKVTLAEAQAGVKEWFTRKDKNKDGVLTRDEFGPGKHGDKDRRS